MTAPKEILFVKVFMFVFIDNRCRAKQEYKTGILTCRGTPKRIQRLRGLSEQRDNQACCASQA
jgi:hypothetical protein